MSNDLVEGRGGQPMVRLRSADGASAEIYLHGAHVTSWRPANEAGERLYLSERSVFDGRSAIRGGIPVIFPQFAERGPLPRHGFARTRPWTFVGATMEDDGAAGASFLLLDSPDTRATWPVPFLATLTVVVGGSRLSVTLSVENTGQHMMEFTGALHSYLRVGDVERLDLVGLHGTPYRESTEPDALRVDGGETVEVRGAMDRAYMNASPRLVLREGDRELLIESAGFPDAVVWNPGAAAAAKLADMDAGGERHMLCVEAAAVESPVVVGPGLRWTGSQVLTARPRTVVTE